MITTTDQRYLHFDVKCETSMFGLLRILFSQPQAFMTCKMHESNDMFLIFKAILAVLFFFSVNGSGNPNRKVDKCRGTSIFTVNTGRSLKGRRGKRPWKMYPSWLDKLMFDGIYLKQYDAKMPIGLSQLSVFWILL